VEIQDIANHPQKRHVPGNVNRLVTPVDRQFVGHDLLPELRGLADGGNGSTGFYYCQSDVLSRRSLRVQEANTEITGCVEEFGRSFAGAHAEAAPARRENLAGKCRSL
jgi:hypothetical protein